TRQSSSPPPLTSSNRISRATPQGGAWLFLRGAGGGTLLARLRAVAGRGRSTLCRGPVRGPSCRCTQCNQSHQRHGSVVSVQVVHTLYRVVLLITRRSWVRALPAPPRSFPLCRHSSAAVLSRWRYPC